MTLILATIGALVVYVGIVVLVWHGDRKPTHKGDK
jgi:hypothetical protein